MFACCYHSTTAALPKDFVGDILFRGLPGNIVVFNVIVITVIVVVMTVSCLLSFLLLLSLLLFSLLSLLSLLLLMLLLLLLVCHCHCEFVTVIVIVMLLLLSWLLLLAPYVSFARTYDVFALHEVTNLRSRDKNSCTSEIATCTLVCEDRVIRMTVSRLLGCWLFVKQQLVIIVGFCTKQLVVC